MDSTEPEHAHVVYNNKHQASTSVSTCSTQLQRETKTIQRQTWLQSSAAGSKAGAVQHNKHGSNLKRFSEEGVYLSRLKWAGISITW